MQTRVEATAMDRVKSLETAQKKDIIQDVVVIVSVIEEMIWASWFLQSYDLSIGGNGGYGNYGGGYGFPGFGGGIFGK